MRSIAIIHRTFLAAVSIGLGVSAHAGNLLSNSGFETGGLAPWTSSDWQVVSDQAYSGTYSAKVVGNYAIQQSFAPASTANISEVSVWLKQDPAAISYVALQYSDFSESYTLAMPTNTGWNNYDLTGLMTPGKTAVGFVVYGYSGGSNGPTWIDDAKVVAAVPEPGTIAALGLGAAAMLRRRRAAR
ncbi:PEP-CTERM sorting domain-containing protein [bacterium]|nr:MAG: PEP-CTERM sorting domain-containing protein [bacterium]